MEFSHLFGGFQEAFLEPLESLIKFKIETIETIPANFSQSRQNSMIFPENSNLTVFLLSVFSYSPFPSQRAVN